MKRMRSVCVRGLKSFIVIILLLSTATPLPVQPVAAAQVGQVGQVETPMPGETATTAPGEVGIPGETSTQNATNTETQSVETAAPEATQAPTSEISETAIVETAIPEATQTTTSEPSAEPTQTQPEHTLEVPDEPLLEAGSSMAVQAPAGNLQSGVPLISKIAAGGGHTCFLTMGGAVKCWGYNLDGELGDGTTSNLLTPVDVSGFSSGVQAIATGGYHTCALTTSGGVKCWGYNDYGELGDGTTTKRYTPVDVSGLGSGVAAIAAGNYHTCALMTGGGVKCWGWSGYGQLGDGTTTNRYTPVEVSGLGSGVAAIAAGGHLTCALTAGGAVKCWGYNGEGALGDGTNTNRSIPVDVSGLSSGVAAIATSGWHTCALMTSGGVKCWGWNIGGQLGDGTDSSRLTPVDVSGLGSGVAAIAASGYSGDHTCALTTGGAVKCWGWNDYGQLGDGTTTNRLTAVDVNGLGSGVQAITAGHQHTCALTTGGEIKCWGYNGEGELGNGTTTYRSIPVFLIVFSPPGAASLISPSGILTTQPVFIWNAQTYATGYRLIVTNGAEEIINLLNTAEQVECSSGKGQCVLVLPSDLPEGNYTWKIQTQNSYGDGDWSSVLNFTIYTGSCWSVSLSASPWWAGNPLVTNTSAKCKSGKFAPGETVQLTPGTQPDYTFSEWGGDFTGSDTEFSMPERNATITAWFIRSEAPSINKIAAGDAHTCALTTGGAVKCWGGNWLGQLGDGTTTMRLTPVYVSGLGSGVSAIAAGLWNYGGHTCALTTGGAVKCWGKNLTGQLGDGTTTNRSIPVDVSGLSSGVAAIAAGAYHTCALTTGGWVKCWGGNQWGQLGDGTTTGHLTPVIISSLGNRVAAITAGISYTCALTTGGAVKCWGNNAEGELGDGTITNRSIPVDVSGLNSGVQAISAGWAHTCALTTGGAVKCWGYNSHGQLGDGTTTNRTIPVDVNGLSSGVIAVIAGTDHTCTLMAGGAVKCWGYNQYGQLGDGTTTTRLTAVDVSGLGSGVQTIAAGTFHTCAITTGGGVKCWGLNDSGQLGDGTTSDRLTPVIVIGYSLPGAASLISPSGRINTTQPTFVWSAVQDTTDYRLNVNNASGEIINQVYSATQVNCSNIRGQCSLVSPSVLPDGNYTWKVLTKNSYGDGDWSSIANFNVFTGSCWSVNLTANPTEGGSPSVTNISTLCSGGKFAPDETVQITPGTNSGYLYNNWTGDVIVTGNQFSMGNANVDETANYLIAYSISGNVSYNGENLAGVTISGGDYSSLTGNDGAYTLSGLSSGNYTLTPSKTGFTFIPPTITVIDLNSNLSGQNFEAISSEVPNGTLQINQGALSTTSNVVTLRLTTSGSTPTEMSLSNNGMDWSDWQAFATSLSWNLIGEDGEKTVYARYRDALGQYSALPITNTIRLDTVAGTDYSISINSGALFSGQVNVDLATGALPGTVAMKVSNDGGFSGTNWEPYTSHKSWTIIQYGSYTIPRTVYVRFKDAEGATSSTYQDDIILDMNAPAGSVSVLSYSASAITLRTNATDVISGVGQMRLSTVPTFSTASWRPYTTSASLAPSNTGMAYVQYKDNAGNISSTYSAAVCYQLTKVASPTTYGTVTVSPTNSSGCTAGKYKAGQVITFTAVAKLYYHLDRWSSALVNASTNKMTMPAANINIIGYFTANLRKRTYDDTYTTGINHTSAWLTQSGALFYGRTQHYTNVKGSTVTINYTGTLLKIYYTQGKTYGKVTIQIDARAPVVLSEYAATTLYKKLWIGPTLANGNHKAVITYYAGNPTNTPVNFDGVIIQ